ncbi:hypothetical protein CAP36_14825 [Chitinophagaceae bacterium IBVUCB2]|nr:hypothetical protein CAP36_14825 [Chitinophagaceae bacterium IBVUCB2]
MKKIYFFIVFLFPLAIAAQKTVDLYRYRFTVQHRSLPEIKLDSTYRTYHVEVEGTQLMQSFLQDLSPEKTVLLEGWRKLQQDGHVGIKVKLGDLLPESVSVKERAESIKDRNGNVTGTRIYYRQEVVYSFDANATITDYRGMHIMDQQLADRRNKQIYRSPEFAIRPLAEGYFVLNSLAVTRDLYRNCVNKAMHYLSERITTNFGFGETTSNDFMWIIDSRKHPEYAAHRNAFQQMNEVLFSMNATSSIEGTREQLQPVIDYFEKIKKKYSSTNKHDRKIRYASYFNLAVLYYYLDDPQAMMKEANGLELNDFDAKDAKGFAQTATWLKNVFQKTNIYTRHFAIDPSKFKGPYEKEDITAK